MKLNTAQQNEIAGRQFRTRQFDRFPLLTVTIIAIWVAVLGIIIIDTQYANILQILLAGVEMTLSVTFISFFFAVILGIVIALLRCSQITWLSQISNLYVQIVRGIPILVFLFYVAFVLTPSIVVVANWITGPLQIAGWISAVTVRNFDLSWRAIFALSVCYSAFLSEIFRAGIEAVQKGQIEASLALGLSRFQSFRLIVFPQAVRIIFPPLGNQLIAMVKDSSLVSVLGVQDITQIANVYSAATYNFFDTYNVLTILYLTIVVALSAILHHIENHIKLY